MTLLTTWLTLLLLQVCVQAVGVPKGFISLAAAIRPKSTGPHEKAAYFIIHKPLLSLQNMFR